MKDNEKSEKGASEKPSLRIQTDIEDKPTSAYTSKLSSSSTLGSNLPMPSSPSSSPSAFTAIQERFDYDKTSHLFTTVQTTINMDIVSGDLSENQMMQLKSNPLMTRTSLKSVHESVTKCSYLQICLILTANLYLLGHMGTITYFVGRHVSNYKVWFALAAVWWTGAMLGVAFSVIAIIGKESTLSAVLAQQWKKRAQYFTLTCVPVLTSIATFINSTNNAFEIENSVYELNYCLGMFTVGFLIFINLFSIPKFALGFNLTDQMKLKIQVYSSLIPVAVEKPSFIEMLNDKQRKVVTEGPTVPSPGRDGYRASSILSIDGGDRKLSGAALAHISIHYLLVLCAAISSFLQAANTLANNSELLETLVVFVVLQVLCGTGFTLTLRVVNSLKDRASKELRVMSFAIETMMLTSILAITMICNL